MSYNLRMDTTHDGPYAWPHRGSAVQWVWNEVDAAVVGIQEGLPHQVDDLSRWFPQYKAVGIGRNADGKGESVSLFYKPSLLTCLDHGNFWLSATPDVAGSTSFGNRIPRMCTWARFADNEGHRWFVLNTHLDHQSEEARVQGAALIRDFLQEHVTDEAVVVTGDFNATPDSDAMGRMLADGTLVDALARCGATGPTFHGYSDEGKSRIDYVLVGSDVRVTKAAVVEDKPEGMYPSDHYPIYAEFAR